MVLGRVIAWVLDASVVAFLSTVAFAAGAQSGSLGSNAWSFFILALSAALVGMLVLQTRTGTSMQEVAEILDEKLGFKDRLSSALRFYNSSKPTGFMRAHMQETNEFLQNRPQAHLPIPWPQRTKAYILFLAIVLTSLLPHEDRVRIEALDKQNKLKQRKQQATQIAKELSDIRRRSDLAGLTRLSSMVMEVQRAISEQMDLLPPKEQDEAPKSDTPTDSTSEKSQDSSSQVAMDISDSGASGNNPRLSQVASYRPVGRFDSFPAESYSEVFSELDNLVISDDFLTSKELQALSDHVNDVAAKLGNFGYFKDEQASRPESGPGAQYGQMDPDEADDPFRAGLAPLQYKAFSEFLKRYAAHLGEKALGKAHLEHLAKQKAESDRGKILNISTPPPKDGKYSVQSASQKPQGPMIQGTPKQVSKVASQVLSGGKVTSNQSPENSLKVTGGGTQPGGKGAGVGGGGGARAPSPKVIPTASGGEYLPLDGKLSDGRSVIQIIDARGKRKLGKGQTRISAKVTYKEVFKGYAQGAEAELAGESVPLQMRDYVRQYFLSIRPKGKRR